MRYSIIFILLSTFLSNCGKKTNETPPATPQKSVNIPDFNADSAFYYVQSQVDFGPRIPNTPAHNSAAAYFVNEFKRFGAAVQVQEFTATTFDNKKVMLKNIIASFYPEKTKRILLAAHWDTRPFADKDDINPNAKFDGANDGASGVGVLLEIGRLIKQQAPDVGIDIILFDGEDWGEREGEYGNVQLPKGLDSWWCLGSQHWSKNKHKPNYSAYFGILLDMVGGKDARFAREGYSLQYAPSVVNKVWNAAARLGFAGYFISEKQGGITDDHVFVNEYAKIPMVNIVSYDPATGFGDFHHTQHDNMELISKETLKAVGQTVVTVIYNE